MTPPERYGQAAAAFSLIQLVPYSRACADCHSNQTQWPWYSNVAAVSWLAQPHIDEGRSKFSINVPGFGPWDEEAAEAAQEGGTPEKTCLRVHPEARLTPEETQAVIRSLQQTFGGEGSETDTGEAD